jgi:hypothetical protein
MASLMQRHLLACCVRNDLLQEVIYGLRDLETV